MTDHPLDALYCLRGGAPHKDPAPIEPVAAAAPEAPEAPAGDTPAE